MRFWVVDAGPSLDTDFHIVGTILNTAYPFADLNPADIGDESVVAAFTSKVRDERHLGQGGAGGGRRRRLGPPGPGRGGPCAPLPS